MTKKVDTTIYPEVYSLAESLAILDKYKSDLTDEQYQQNKSVISSFAIENMYLNEKNILNCKNRAEPDTDVGVRPDAKTEFNRTVKRS